MQKFMKKRKARGFTLVELLIVIIIIGILAGALLLVAGAGTDKAEATKIVSNLRGMKAAAIMTYADYNEWPTEVASLGEYMEKSPGSDYSVAEGYVEYTPSDISAGVQEKLSLMVTNGEVPIYQANTCTSSDLYAGDGDTSDQDSVFMKLN